MPHRSRALICIVVAATACQDSPQPLAPAEIPVHLALAGSFSGSVIYSNFGREMAFESTPSTAWTINGFLGPSIGQQAISQRFVPPSNYALRAIQLGVTGFPGKDSLRVYVQMDSLGRPGQVLESIPVGGFGTSTGIVTANSRIFPVLRQQMSYWVSLVAGGSGVIAGWNWNSIGDRSTSNFAVTQGGSAGGPWSVMSNSLRGAFQVSGTPPQQGLTPVTLDDVEFPGGATLAIGGPGILYQATISNRTTGQRAGLAMKVFIEQGEARRAAGDELITCAAAPGALQMGTCVWPSYRLMANNTYAGRGSLVPGPATAIVQLVQLTPNGYERLGSRAYPITLSGPQGVLSVNVAPSDTVLDQIGITAQLVATVQATGGVSTGVSWMSSNPAVAPVSATGRVTAVAPGAALITATSIADPSKSATTLVSVLATPSRGNGVNVSPGRLDLLPSGIVQLAAQLVGGASSPFGFVWLSSNSAVVSVSSLGQVTGIAPGTATIFVHSKVDATAMATVQVTVHDLYFTAPVAPVSVSAGVTNPPANPTVVTVSVTVSGPSGIFQPPFTRVDFFASVGGSPVNIGTGALQVIDNGVSRSVTWRIAWTPGAAFGTGVQTIFAVAYNSSGRVGQSLSNSNITVTNP